MEKAILRSEQAQKFIFPLNSTSLNFENLSQKVEDKPINNQLSFPLFNEFGELKGLSQLDNSQTYYIASSDFTGILEKVDQNKLVQKKYLGVSLKNSSGEGGGVFVIRVTSESPFSSSGVKMGDVIVGVNGARIQSINCLTKMLGYREDEVFELIVKRDNKFIMMPFVL